MRRTALLLLFLSACSLPPPNAEMLDEAAVAELVDPQPAQASPTPATQKRATAESPDLAQTETAPAPATQSSNLPSFQLCSPLSLHPLSELPQIIGDPYDPPRPGREERHHGIDFAYYHYADRDSMQGEPIQAILAGVVASALHDLYPYGNMVMIETSPAILPAEIVALLGFQPEESLYVLYAHMDDPPIVSAGDLVDACQRLGEVGMTGNTELPHLHLETRLGPAGSIFESMRFYDTRASLEELEVYKLWRTSGVYRHFDPMKLLSIPRDPTLPLLGNP